ncbi:MAG: 50S ribosomal protein L24 [archaeon]|nr:50S ribosomal protein L24 [archaeon]
MDKEWSGSWKGSKESAKQRKYSYNSPLHVKRKFLSANLSDTLKKKMGKSSVPVRLGDEVIVKRGSFKGITGEILKVIIKKGVLHVKGVVRKKTDGTEIQIPLHPSNVQMVAMNLDDSRRIGGGSSVKAAKKAGSVKKVESAAVAKVSEKKGEPEKKPKAAAEKVSEKEEKKIDKADVKAVDSSGSSDKVAPVAKKLAPADVKKAETVTNKNNVKG